MKPGKTLPGLLPILAWVQAAAAFSPYEAYLMSGRETHVGLVAGIREGRLTHFEDTFRKCASASIRDELSQAGIAHLQAFTRNLEDHEYAVIYFTYAGDQPYLGAAASFEKATRTLDWQACTSPHPRARTYQRQWLQMEWINFIHGLDVDRRPTETMVIGTTILPEMEMQYRTLHQTVWPGVVDQAIRGNIRNLNIYLVELEDRLVEFLYLEYMGSDREADDRLNQSDPVNQRWWKLTDACQKPFSEVTTGNWTSLRRVQ